MNVHTNLDLTQNSLSVPRYPAIDGAYYGKIPYLCPDIPVSTGLITVKSLSVPRCTNVEGIIDLV